MFDILVIMGSDSDLKSVSAGLELLEEFGVTFEVRVSSAHRSLERTMEIVDQFEKNDGKVIIAAAGMSAHLAGVIAAHTILPVLGIPLSSPDFGSLDSMLSMIEMPPGIPVGVMGKGRSGSKNAALLALQILALSNPDLAIRMRDYRKKLTRQVQEKDNRLQEKGWKDYSGK